MRKTINISVPESMHKYIVEQADHGSVSEYIRGLVRREQARRADYAARPIRPLARANDARTFVDALEQLDKLRDILQKKDPY